MTQKTILLTGGTGFIASHTAVQLIQSGYTVVLVDNLANSQKSVVCRIENITQKSVPFYKANVCNPSALQKIFKIHDIYAVVHFAALKSVGESVKNPNLYYKNNIGGLESVLAVMEQNDCYNLVFSSSATVYGTPEKCPIVETHPLRATNPYGETKIACEEILQARHSKKWHMAILRYFNPIGAHPSGDLGEDPRVFLIILPLMWHRLQPVNWNLLACLAMTITPPMVRGYAIISMLWIWQMGMYRHCTILINLLVPP